MRTTFRVVFSVGLIVLLFSSANAQQPRRVLFETFTNSFDQCPLANGLDAAFKQTLASSNGSKLIHINHHIGNVGDPMVVAGGLPSLLESLRLSEDKNYIFMGAVDHTAFAFEGTRVTSQYTPNGANEWNARINERVGELPLVSITLSDAKLDQIGQSDYWRLIATIKVTLQDDNNDSLRFFYAITEDGITFKQCESTKPVVVTNHDNVSRFIDVHGIALDLKGKSAGASTEVTISHDISKEVNYGFNLANMKLIGFVERGTSANYEVVQSWVLRENFQTLPPPPAAITISNETLDGKSYAPEDNILIIFDKTNVDSVKLEYSTDNGSNWLFIENINNDMYFWKAPDITTTAGKIRVSELKTGTPSAVSTGNFTIEMPLKRITIVKPKGADTAFIGKPFVIEWTKTGSEPIEKVDLHYSTNGGSNWVFLKPGVSATTFTWNVFGVPVTEQALIRITEVTDSVEKLTAISDPFYIMEANVGKVQSSNITSGIRLYPQPVEKNNVLTVEFTLSEADRLQFALYDLLGKQVYGEKATQMSIGHQSHTLQLPALPSGIYILSMRDSQGGQIAQKVEIR